MSLALKAGCRGNAWDAFLNASRAGKKLAWELIARLRKYTTLMARSPQGYVGAFSVQPDGNFSLLEQEEYEYWNLGLLYYGIELWVGGNMAGMILVSVDTAFPMVGWWFGLPADDEEGTAEECLRAVIQSLGLSL